MPGDLIYTSVYIAIPVVNLVLETNMLTVKLINRLLSGLGARLVTSWSVDVGFVSIMVRR